VVVHRMEICTGYNAGSWGGNVVEAAVPQLGDERLAMAVV
jgi:hypothetical protein